MSTDQSPAKIDADVAVIPPAQLVLPTLPVRHEGDGPQIDHQAGELGWSLDA